MPFLLGFISMFITAHADDANEASLAPSEASAAAVASDDEQGDHARTLKDALHLYQRGDAPMAQRALARFINDPSMADESLRQRARVYLGEVLYQQQNEEEARRIFEAVLTLDPNYTIDPFAHPPDVCGFFETVRAYIVPLGPTVAQAPPDPLPSSAYVGFGVYHFQAGDPRSGTKIAIAQTTAGLISLVTFAGLLDEPLALAGFGHRQHLVDDGLDMASLDHVECIFQVIHGPERGAD